MVKNQHKNKENVVKMMILCWIYSKIRRDKIINDIIRESIEVEHTIEKMVENKLR